jgi:hypothetical protein
VKANGAPFETYSVYRRKDGLRAVIFANMSDTETVTCEVVLDQPKTSSLRWVSPEQPEPQPWTGKLELAPGSAGVVIER